MFAEDWDDGLGADRWSEPLFALENTDLEFDGAVDYSFDYSDIGAPSAPNSTGGSTSGVFLETNLTEAGEVNEGESVGILPDGFTLPEGDFTLTADVYIFWNGGPGSTEYATLGVHHQRTSNVPMRFNVNSGDGIAWQVDSDGDSGTDILEYINLDGAGAETGIGGYEDIADGTIPNVPTGTASPLGPFNQWVELKIERTGDLFEFAMNDYVIDIVEAETGAFFTAGTLLIGQSDPFNSVNVDDGSGNSNGVVFDNIRVVGPDTALAGDANGDGTVDLLDLDILGANFGTTSGGTVMTGDFNADGAVDLLDLDILGANFGSSVSVSVPEPAAIALVTLAIGFIPRRRS